MNHLANLNPKQKEAATAIKGPLMILAGAGSGKTKTLTSRIIHLITAHGVFPSEILAVTFTNKAAGEMKERISKELQGTTGVYELPIVSTFHAFCARFLRLHWQEAGLGQDFTIYDDKDQLSLIKKVMESLGISSKMQNPKSVMHAINAYKNQALLPEGIRAESREEGKALQLYAEYEKQLAKNNAVDFGGLILTTYRVLKENPRVRAFYHEKIKYLHVDEYQDTNRVQYLLVKELALGSDGGGSQNICVVGDEDQSIYGWRGADIRNILDFEKDFPKTRVIKLEQNYRSSSRIIQAATEVIQNNEYRKDKKLWTENPEGELIRHWVFKDERHEANGIVSDIATELESGRSPNEVAIFYRTNAQSRNFEDYLRKSGLPYQIVGGIRFYERKEVKDLLSYLKVIVNPADEVSLERIINVPSRGIGTGTIKKLREWATAHGVGLFEAIQETVRSGSSGVSSAPRKKLGFFLDLMADLIESTRLSEPLEVFHRVIDETGYVTLLREEGTIEAESRIENIGELEQAIRDFQKELGEEASVSRFLESITLRSDVDELGTAASAISLMTVHSSKGLEFPLVYVGGLEEGLFPSLRGWEEDLEELEEERRLFYVAMTRAKTQLTVTQARCRRTFGNVNFNEPARFLSEIPGDLVEYRDFSEAEFLRQADRDEKSFYRSMGHLPDEMAEGGDWAYDDEVVYDLDEGNSSDPYAPYRMGRKIKHPVYGLGVIRTKEGRGESTKLVVQFHDQSVRKFLVKYANLELV